MKRSFLFFFVVLFIATLAYGSVTTWQDYDTTPTVVQTNLPIHVQNYWTVPATNIAIMKDGTIRQLEWGPTPGRERKFGVLFNTGFQVENIINDIGHGNDLENANIYQRQWQSPKNGSFLITQYGFKTVEIGGNPVETVDWDAPLAKYAASATSDTVLVIQWIKDGFVPVDVDEFTSPPLQMSQ